MSISDQLTYIDSDSDNEDSYEESDDSQEDPNFDVLEATRSSFSSLSIKKKPRNDKEDDETVEVEVPELDEKDKKSYETIEKLIKAGQVEKLKVEQCKVYLRKHGLRLTGNKDTLIQRIKEHLDIIDGSGERKYPASSFVLNCKGDACMGDIVMFEQNVYEMFSIASRSATGPPCGTRIVVGRIVNESYGAAKQQHTFTIEVLWSKGEKPLSPLHPLLIKGRNLYRLKTLRQRWEDETERQKILSEKHARGAAARSNREARVQEKEMRKMLKSNRISRTTSRQDDMNNQKLSTVNKMTSRAIAQHGKQDDTNNQQQQTHYHKQNPVLSSGPCQNSFVPPEALQKVPSAFLSGQILPQGIHQQRQPITDVSVESSRIPFQVHNDNRPDNVCPPVHRYSYEERSGNYNARRSPQRGTITYNPLNTQMQRPAYHGNSNFNRFASPPRGQYHEQKQTCRFYAQGRCYHGDSCKYLHESGENHHGQKQSCPYFAQGRCYYGDRCKYLHKSGENLSSK